MPRHHQNLQHDFWENVQDLQKVEQANIEEGWQQPELFPNAAAAANLNGGWEQWPQQAGEIVDQNELNQVIAQANAVVEQAILQHPDTPQVSDSVSSKALDFFRAQGPPVTLELPLTNNSTDIVPYLNNGMDAKSDYSVRSLANKLGLHQVFGPSPSVQMLL